jgi:hypothetical protein
VGTFDPERKAGAAIMPKDTKEVRASVPSPREKHSCVCFFDQDQDEMQMNMCITLITSTYNISPEKVSRAHLCTTVVASGYMPRETALLR